MYDFIHRCVATMADHNCLIVFKTANVFLPVGDKTTLTDVFIGEDGVAVKTEYTFFYKEKFDLRCNLNVVVGKQSLGQVRLKKRKGASWGMERWFVCDDSGSQIDTNLNRGEAMAPSVCV